MCCAQNRFFALVSVCIALCTTDRSSAAGLAPLFAESACNTLLPASAGGSMPKDKHLMVLRWLGWSTYEVAYDGKVILLDAFIDSDSRNVGLNVADVHHADAILIGHPHFDHILNAPQLSAQTGAPIFVAPAGRKYLEQQGVRPEKIKYVRGGDKIEMAGFTVQTALAIHSTIDPSLTKKSTEFLSAVDGMSETERRAFMDNLKATTLADPNVPEEDIVHQGTIAYLITFADGTRVSFRDSPAAPTEAERELIKTVADKGKRIDVGIVGYQGPAVRLAIKEATLPLARSYHPRLLLPAHEDRAGDGYADMAVAPLVVAMRAELPDVSMAEPVYRSPICYNISSGSIFNNINAR
jgi:L-ascorbate metabolism protein UlaG (beta-lactamase superfamily)